ncbi:MAG: sugar transferase [Bacteroidales bacterium]|jgi:lipopolysaccharide/colanic/teichoic acid biosynthesis glycosyltransferase|nr:sugar transferase [Bacteroidales bacterium]
MNRRSVLINTFFDILVLFAAFFIMIWIKPATKRIYLPTYILPFLVFAFTWIVVSLITQKYSVPKQLKLSRVFLHIIITNIIITGIVTILIFLLRSDFYSRLVFGGIVLITSVIEIFFAICDYYICNASVGPDTSRVFEAYQKVSGYKAEIPISEPFPPELLTEPVPENIKEAIVEESNLDVFNFLCENLDLNIPNYSLLATSTQFNVTKLPEKKYSKIVNLKRINDIRFINKFFESVNYKLPEGGIFIACVETKDQRKKRILRKFPPVINGIYYFLDFIIKRVFPKFNLTKRLYFFLTRGENRVISKAETLGRLYSCGFEIKNEKNINGWLYVVAKKIRAPFLDSKPTYGPLIRLRRIGKNGKMINVYKLRTMHPFAEYLQQYIYELSDLQDGGKFKDDFRITTAGKIFRKFWLDELPMFINYFRGELKLVGVRPLSEQYYSLYSKELKEKRTKVKPGLIPPYYVDMPKTLDDIQSSELKYLDLYSKQPLRTDWKYFWKAMWNIMFKNARSA